METLYRLPTAVGNAQYGNDYKVRIFLPNVSACCPVIVTVWYGCRTIPCLQIRGRSCKVVSHRRGQHSFAVKRLNARLSAIPSHCFGVWPFSYSTAVLCCGVFDALLGVAYLCLVPQIVYSPQGYTPLMTSCVDSALPYDNSCNSVLFFSFCRHDPRPNDRGKFILAFVI